MTRFQLPLLRSETLLPSGTQRDEATVACPRRSQLVDLEACQACPYLRRISRLAVTCNPPAASLPSGGCSTVSRYASPRVVAAHESVPLKRIIEVDAASLPVPVVDDDGRFVGFVRPPEPDVGLPPRLVRSLPASELIFGRSLWIRDGASVSDALRAMAAHHARALAIVDPRGRLRGIVRDIDGLRALGPHALCHER
jgi:hypothetical protein